MNGAFKMEKALSATLTVSNDWLNTDLPPTQSTNNDWTGGSIRDDTKYYYANNNWYPYVTYWHYNYLPKIQLKLSEIEKLRKVAKENPEIKETLNKFTAHIEVVVDF